MFFVRVSLRVTRYLCYICSRRLSQEIDQFWYIYDLFLKPPRVLGDLLGELDEEEQKKILRKNYFNYKLVTGGGLYSVLFLKSLSCFSNTLLYLPLAHSTAKQGYIKHATKAKQVKNNATITIEIICIVSIL